MPSAPCYIVSDTHLGAAPRDVERSFLAFLRQLTGSGASLLINGDLFDFWFEWRSVVPTATFRTLAALADLREAGSEVLWIAGNHDCWGGEVLRKQVGVDYHVGPWNGMIAGWHSLVEHGDGLRAREDRRYRALRRFLRHPAAIRAFRWVHPDWGSLLATGSSQASRVHRARDGGAGLRQIALDQLARRPHLDLVLYGHSHVAALERAAGGGVYANAGSWLEAPTYLQVIPERIELRQWLGSAESECLHSENRRPEEALPQG